MPKKPDRRRATTDVRLELRRQMQLLHAQGKTHVEIAAITGYTRTYVSTMLKRLASEPALLEVMSRGGRPQGSLRASTGCLRTVAEKLDHTLADVETTNWRRPRAPEVGLALSRVSGNGFAALLLDLPNIDAAAGVARRALAALAEPFTVYGRRMFVTASIGLACFPADGEDFDTLLRHAEMAMYQAKDRGRNTYEFFSQDLNARAAERMALETQLRQAIERDQLMLYYQPKVEIQGGRIVGAEALLRWKSCACCAGRRNRSSATSWPPSASA